MTSMETNLTCTGCRAELDAHCYYASKGRTLQPCKECWKARVRARFKSRSDALKETDRAAMADRARKYRSKLTLEQRESFAFKKREARAARTEEDRLADAEMMRRRYAERRESRLAYAAEYRSANKQKVSESFRRWSKANPEAVRSRSHARRAAVAKRAVGWDSELTNLAGTEAADLARRMESITGFKWHVDHVVPLRGRDVSGLHVWSNFAVVPASFNLMKKNKFFGDWAGGHSQ